MPLETRTSVSVVLIFRAKFANALLRLWPAVPKFFDTRILLQPSASKPEGPLEPLVRKAAFAMVDSVIFSNMTGSTNGGSPSVNRDGSASLAAGCFCFNSFMVLSDNGNTPLPPWWSRSFIAALIFPSSTSLANVLASRSSFSPLWFVGSFAWMVFASRSKSSNSPCSHCVNRLERHWECCFAVDLNEGFWRSRAGITINTFSAMSLYSFTSWFQNSIHFVVSEINFYPAAPLGSLNRFRLQKAIFSYITSILWWISSLVWSPHNFGSIDDDVIWLPAVLLTFAWTCSCCEFCSRVVRSSCENFFLQLLRWIFLPWFVIKALGHKLHLYRAAFSSVCCHLRSSVFRCILTLIVDTWVDGGEKN